MTDTASGLERGRGRLALLLARQLTGIGARFLDAPQRHRRTQFEATGTAPGHIVFLGDSITEYGNWDEWFPQHPVLNRGIGGEATSQVLARLDTAINDPLAVFLLIGTNDLSIAVPEWQIVGNVRGILDGIERRAPGTPVYLQSVMPRTARYRPELRSLNAALQRLIGQQRPHVHYIDLWPALADQQGLLPERFSFDHLHLSGDGYRAWVEVLRPLVDEVTAKR